MKKKQKKQAKNKKQFFKIHLRHPKINLILHNLFKNI